VRIVHQDDPEFRKLMIGAFLDKGDHRRFEIHFTDLINCLMCTYMRKVMPERRDDGRYSDILDWSGGLVFDTTITNVFGGKRRVGIGDAQGDIDMMVPVSSLGRSIPYELTSTMFLPRDIIRMVEKRERYAYKINQLKLYMAALCEPSGKFKVLQRFKPRQEVSDNHAMPWDGPKKRFQVIEHTFSIELTPLDLARLRIAIIKRARCLQTALSSPGAWNLIPENYRPILKDSWCKDENGICRSYQWAKTHYQNVLDAWKIWLSRKVKLSK
jgi:hypothetical protein